MRGLVNLGANAARFAAFVVIVAITGCGGGGGGDDDKPNTDSPQGPTAVPLNISGKALELNGSENRRIEFASSGDLWIEDQNGYTTGGTYQYTPNGSSAELILTDSVGDNVIQLDFIDSGSGSYKLSSTGGQGDFRLDDVEGTNPNPDPGGEPGDPSTQAPASLDGRTMYGTRTFTSTGPVGQTHVYTFTGNTFHDSDPPEESDGAYLYEPSGNKARLSLNYYAPRSFNGDRHVLEMHFQSPTRGTFESTYTRRDGTVIVINGAFQIE